METRLCTGLQRTEMCPWLDGEKTCAQAQLAGSAKDLLRLWPHHAVFFLMWLMFALDSLLLHGASVVVRNKAGQRAFDLVDFDLASDDDSGEPEAAAAAPGADEMKDTGPAPAAATGSKAFGAHLAGLLKPALYSSLTHTYERKWGTAEGLRVEQCSYVGESDSAAIKRLLFQRMLFNAVEKGDSGDEAEVKRLVSHWQRMQAEGKRRMWPLVYRADVDEYSPIQSCVAMEDQAAGHKLLKIILQLPNNLHVQSYRPEWMALSLAITSGNVEAADILIKGQSLSKLAAGARKGSLRKDTAFTVVSSVCLLCCFFLSRLQCECSRLYLGQDCAHVAVPGSDHGSLQRGGSRIGVGSSGRSDPLLDSALCGQLGA